MMAAHAASGWDGLYVGANVGYGWGTATDTNNTNTTSLTGYSIGAQVGYNFHVSDSVIFGVEADLNWSNEQGTFTNTYDGFSSRINWNGSVRGRLGYDAGQFLPYVEAGIAFANATYTDDFTSTPPFTAKGTYTGLTVGAGVEYKLADQLSVNLEYRYTDYGTVSFTDNGVGITDSTVRLGLNYHVN
jgi:outer membrane immunogenic protein